MVENSETIEARLCAYVDGELDANERAELEKHLEGHPQHRRLLAELAAQRDLLRRLPREPAPVDLAEMVQDQLERNALLMTQSAADPEPLAINAVRAWPRLLATAAVIALMAGIGWMAYIALPKSPTGGSHAQYSLADGKAKPATTQAPEPTASDSMAKRDVIPPVPARAMAEDNVDDPSGVREMAVAAEPGLPAAEPVTLLVTARDLPAANTQVESFLTQNSLVWRGAGEGPANENAPNAASGAATSAPAGTYGGGGGYGGRTGGAYGGGYGGYGGYGGLARSPATGPANGPAAPTPAVAAVSRSAAELNTAAQYAVNDSRVSAYQTRMTRRQASALRSELSNRDGQQADLRSDAARNRFQAKLVGDSNTAQTPDAMGFLQAATRPSAPAVDATSPDNATQPNGPAADNLSTIQLSETLKITVDELAGPDQDKTTHATVSPDGTIQLPKLGESVPALGRTPAELAQEIARHYREAKVIDAATVTVEHGALAAPAETLVDVTIIVQPNEPPAALSATAPSAAVRPLATTRAASAPTTRPLPARPMTPTTRPAPIATPRGPATAPVR